MPQPNHAPEVLSSPLYAVPRPGSGIELAWAVAAAPQTHTVLGYEPVRGSEVEQLAADQREPSRKDVGMFMQPDPKADTVRVGELILMKVSATRKAARIQQEQERMKGIRPRRSDRAESETVTEEEVKLADEIAATTKS